MKMETVIKNLSTNKSPEPDSLTDKFYKTFRQADTYPFSIYSKNTEVEGIIPNSFYKTSVILVLKLDK